MSRLHPATRRRTLRMLAAVPYLLLPRSVLAAPSRRWTVTGTRAEELDSLDAAMQRLLQRYAVRAGSLAVARQGKLLFARGYTWAEPDYPVTQADSPFRLASVSKAFTAAVIYQLLQAKKLELQLQVFPWLGLDRAALPAQSVDSRLATINVQQLINHRGGWDSRARGEFRSGVQDASDRPQAWFARRAVELGHRAVHGRRTAVVSASTELADDFAAHSTCGRALTELRNSFAPGCWRG